MRDTAPEILTSDELSPQREYPVIPTNLKPAIRPISFVCVKYSNDFFHNIVRSECIQSDLNEFIVVENANNLLFVTLGEAINYGVDRAKNDLVVAVHEDVVLLPGWQSLLEQSLSSLEGHDPNWLVAGAVGRDKDEKVQGHFSDPNRCVNTFQDSAFAEINRLDEQVLILRKSRGLRLDPNVPSIHNIGADMPLQAKGRGGHAYSVNAPTIHKFADADGKAIFNAGESIKIMHRKGLQFIADRECSDEYFQSKWKIDRLWHKTTIENGQFSKRMELTEEENRKLDAPVVLVGRGGSGTRILTLAADDLGVFVGSDVNEMGDSSEMARAIYRAIFRKHKCPSEWQYQVIKNDLRTAAAQMLKNGDWPEAWGFKLPETLLVLPEILSVFPEARFVFLRRHPLEAALQRAHLTARPDTPIGQVALKLAYESLGIPVERVAEDPEYIRMAVTTRHQLSLVLDAKEQVQPDRWFDLDFDQLIVDPIQELGRFERFLDLKLKSQKVAHAIDPNRATKAVRDSSDDVKKRVMEIVHPVSLALGYPD